MKSLLLFLGLFAWASLGHAETLDRVVARVNSDIITLSVLEERVQTLRQKLSNLDNPNPMSEEEMMQAALNTILEEKLLIQEAKKQALSVDEERVLTAIDEIAAQNNVTVPQMTEMLLREGSSIEQYKERIRDQIMTSKLIRYELGNRIKVSDRQIQKYYQDHRKDFWMPAQIHVSHILFIFDDILEEKDKRIKAMRAREVLKHLRAGRDFAELAKKYSEDVSASSGGDIGVIKRGQMVKAFENAAFKLRPGEISNIVESPYGLHIIKSNKIIPGTTKPLEEVKAQITGILRIEMEKKHYKDWVDELRKAAFIEISLAEGSYKTPAVIEESGSLARLTDKNNSDRKKKVRRRSELKKIEKPKLRTKPVSLTNRIVKKDPSLRKMERKLRYVRKLRNDNKISESEYQKRKKILLDQL